MTHFFDKSAVNFDESRFATSGSNLLLKSSSRSTRTSNVDATPTSTMGHRAPTGAIDARAMLVKVRETLAPRRRRATRDA